jgi:hypothetical protein
MPPTVSLPTAFPNNPTMTEIEDAIYDQTLQKVMQILARIPAPSQEELNLGLCCAIDLDGDIRAMEPFFASGAQITLNSFQSAFARHDLVAWQAFIDHGWDINSVEYGDVAIRYESSQSKSTEKY